MSLKLTILGSGRAGNAALLQSPQACVLVDAGFTWRKLSQLVRDAGHDIAQIDAVFITHEHGDHVAGVDGLRRVPGIPHFANHATARVVQSKITHKPSWQIFETGSRFRFRDLEIDTFSVPHDAQDPVGFVFSAGAQDDLLAPRRSLAWLTDLGHVPGHILERLRDVDAIAVEANHCPSLLAADHRRPWSTKQRISGRHGHLSNEAVRDLIDTIGGPKLRNVFLTHLSRDCNTPAAVTETLACLREKFPCLFTVVEAGGGLPAVQL